MSEASSGSSQQPTEIVLASWGTRFLAWLIDFIIVNVVLWAIFAAAAIPFWLTGMPDRWFGRAEGPIEWAVTSLVFFAYWTYFETTTGQSLGKMVMHIKTTDLAGNKVDPRNAAIQSFGKAFLLPIDVILGWIFTNDKRQRIFARAANTIVVKMTGTE
ncbi:RDD family protein [Candidatus Nitrososphaera gargensis Ga9.2]|uniref:RDD family protein n=1 Tax=Nitrososphaera gargensis (strain Ga9.2) TaxID=1237085 RepID=K0I736_NITGG|nr:RDD family protein [Candidatus Nitrososphaera gargensis]AFU57081.1 RDD family protein [Candidatus Nitrososphaera gargensis Ga9.2]